MGDLKKPDVSELKTFKEYLGDGVYLTGDSNQLIISTGNHNPEQWDNVVYMDKTIQDNLFRHLKTLRD